jgi:hypothetical protein
VYFQNQRDVTGAFEDSELSQHLAEEMKRPDLVQWSKGGFSGSMSSNCLEVSAENNLIAVASAFLSSIPSQCGGVLLRHIVLHDTEKAHKLFDWAEEIAKCLGYTTMMITMNEGHIYKAIVANGFKSIYSFVNKRSKNTVHYLIKEFQ